MCLVVRKEDDGIRRYVHLSTGNYNLTTARLYTDVGLLTCQPDFGEDATNVFNLLTGIGHYQDAKNCCWRPLNCTGACSPSSSAKPPTPAAAGPRASSPR
jgi:polyphosphate kinase